MPSIPLYAHMLGASMVEVGLVGFLGGLLYAATATIFGKASDKFGRRVLLILSSSLTAISSISYILSKGVLQVIMLRGILGIASAAWWPIIPALITDLTTIPQRKRSLGIYCAIWGFSLGVGPMLGGLLIDIHGFNFLFILCTFLALFATALTTTIVRDSRHKTRSDLLKLNSTPHIPLTRDKRMLGVFVIGFMDGVIIGIIWNIFSVYAKIVGINPTGIGMLFLTFGIIRTISFFMVGVLAPPSKPSIIFGIIGSSLAVLIITLSNNLYHFLLDMILLGVSMGIVYPLSLTLASEISPKNRGMIIGVMETLIGVGMASGPAIGGYLAERIDLRAPFYFCAMAGCATALMFSVIRSKEAEEFRG